MILHPNTMNRTRRYALLTNAQLETEPTSYAQAHKIGQWRIAMDAEMDALHRTHIWDLVPLPPNANVVGNKWVYKIKRRANGGIDRFKHV